MIITHHSTFSHFNTLVTTLIAKDKCSRLSVWIDVMVKFLRMFICSAFSGETETLLIPLDFAETLTDVKLVKLATKLAHSIKIILFDSSNLKLKCGIDLTSSLPKIVFLAKNVENKAS